PATSMYTWYTAQMEWQACSHPDFPEVIASIIGEAPRGIATIPPRAGPGRPRQFPQDVRGTRHLSARADQESLPDRARGGPAAFRQAWPDDLAHCVRRDRRRHGPYDA